MSKYQVVTLFSLLSAGQLLFLAVQQTTFVNNPWLFCTGLGIINIILVLSYLKMSSLTAVRQDPHDPLKQQLDQMNITGQSISQYTNELAIGSAEVSHFIDGLHLGIDQTRDNLARIGTAAAQLTTNTQKLGDNAQTTLLQARSAATNSGRGQEILQQGMAEINQLNHDVTSTAQRLDQLKEKANSIQSITQVIDGITQQINLLALNAAIEAARAGDQGKGFAVVANEVRSLAAKTTTATADIASMLNEIKDETEATTQMTQKMAQESNAMVSSMQQVTSSLATIDDNVQDSSSMLSEMTDTLLEYSSATAEISNAINNIKSSLDVTSDQSTEISEQAFGLSTSTEKIYLCLQDFDTNSPEEKIRQLAIATCEKIVSTFKHAIQSGQVTEQALFDFRYREIPNTTPTKFHSAFDQFTDKVLPDIQEPLLQQHSNIIYAGAVDINGYFPTHNNKFSKPLTGNVEVDKMQNRTKRMFDDPTGIRCAKNTTDFLLQTYKRDTGEVMHDLSAPIFINNKHWGGFRIGFTTR